MEYKVINLDYLNEVADGDHFFIAELIKAFLMLGLEEIDELKKARTASDWKAVARITHKLKSAAESLGVKVISETASKIEYGIRDVNYQNDGNNGHLIDQISANFVLARVEFQAELDRIEALNN